MSVWNRAFGHEGITEPSNVLRCFKLRYAFDRIEPQFGCRRISKSGFGKYELRDK